MSKCCVSERDTAYAAGFFDGEGCIHIGPQPDYKLQVSLTNTHRPVLEWFQSIWGGSLYDHPAYSRKRWTMCWALQWSNRADREQLLSDLLPHLTVKREQAALALRYLETVNVPVKFRNRDAIVAMRGALHDEWVALKSYVPRREAIA